MIFEKKPFLACLFDFDIIPKRQLLKTQYEFKSKDYPNISNSPSLVKRQQCAVRTNIIPTFFSSISWLKTNKESLAREWIAFAAFYRYALVVFCLDQIVIEILDLKAGRNKNIDPIPILIWFSKMTRPSIHRDGFVMRT